MSRPHLHQRDSLPSNVFGNQAGFTLLETMVAMAIMLVAFASILAVESSSINSSEKAKHLNIAGMLAKSKMIDSEFEWEGKTFDEFNKEAGGPFKDPYQEYKWKRIVKEVKFPALGGPASDKKDGSKGGDEGTDQNTEMLTKLMSNFMTKAIREVTVTISWKKGAGEQSFAVSTYWVNLNNEFQLTE